jgi:nitrogen regulatory protein P-II 1
MFHLKFYSGVDRFDGSSGSADRPKPFKGSTNMKMIIAVIRPEKLEAVQDALSEVEVYLMTVSDVRGCGRQRGFTENYRGNKVVIRLLSKVKLEIAVNEDFVEPAVEAIKRAAHSGQIGDGKIFVLPLDDAIRIRTGEEGSVAIGP